MKNHKTSVHFTHPYLINPTNPVSVILIGAGGTGSNMLSALAKMNHALLCLGHPGLHVNLWDHDRITEANVGRQLFAQSEVGLSKAAVLISRVNRFFGTGWKAVEEQFCPDHVTDNREAVANLYISCVDTVQARMDIARITEKMAKQYHSDRDQPLYWLDTGNARFTGQAILSTIGRIRQPKSTRYKTVGVLPPVTAEFKAQLNSGSEMNEPSCSLAEALSKQDLFINPAIANLAAALLWQLFRAGMTHNRGFFLNIADMKAQPLKVA